MGELNFNCDEVKLQGEQVKFVGKQVKFPDERLMLRSFGSGNLVYSPCTQLVHIVFTSCVRSCDILRYLSCCLT